MVRILSVDDHAMVRKGIIRLLEESRDIQAICHEASQAKEALAKLADGGYDLVLLDVSLPGTSGLDLLKQLHRDYPDLPVLLLSMYPEEQYAIRGVALGAAGYLTKESAADELILAVRKVLSGKRYISPSVAELMAAHLGGSRQCAPLPHENLSDRELQVLRLIGTSKSSSEIADELCLSLKTVSTYRARVMKKIGQRSTVELVKYVVKHNLNG